MDTEVITLNGKKFYREPRPLKDDNLKYRECWDWLEDHVKEVNNAMVDVYQTSQSNGLTLTMANNEGYLLALSEMADYMNYIKDCTFNSDL